LGHDAHLLNKFIVVFLGSSIFTFFLEVSANVRASTSANERQDRYAKK